MKLRVLTAVLMAVGWAGSANAQIITQWNFPTGFDLASPAPSTGSGTASRIGGTSATQAGGLTNAGSTEAVAGSVAWNTSTYPAATAASGTAGVQFNVSTASASNIVVRFDLRHSSTSSRFLQLQYTTDGTTWTSAGTFEANIGLADTWYNNRTADLSGIAAANNNANFGVRVVSIFDPANNTSYTGTAGAYGTTGTYRFDAVTVSAGSVWIGGSGTDLGNAANYAGGVAPTTTGTVLLGPAGGSSTSVNTTVPGGTTLDQLVFRAGAPAYTVSGPGVLTLNAGLINDATVAQTISAPVTFGLSNTVQNAGTVTLGGAVNFTNFLVQQGGGTINFNGTVNGAISALTTGNPAAATVRVANGTLGGTGTVNTPVDVRAGSTIRGDSGSGTGNLNLTADTTVRAAAANGANVATQLAVSGGAISGNSKLALTGPGTDLIFDMTAGKFRITLLGDAGLTNGNTYTIALATANSATNFYRTGSNTDPFTTADFDVVSGSGTWTAFNSVSLVRNAGTNSLDLTFSPVPEPATIGLICVGVLTAGAAVRRKRQPTAV